MDDGGCIQLLPYHRWHGSERGCVNSVRQTRIYQRSFDCSGYSHLLLWLPIGCDSVNCLQSGRGVRQLNYECGAISAGIGVFSCLFRGGNYLSQCVVMITTS